MTSGFVYVARHRHKRLKGWHCTPRKPIYPKFFTEYYTIARWNNCPILTNTIKILMPEAKNIKGNYYEVSFEEFGEVMKEYANFLEKSEWEDAGTCPWGENKQLLKEYLWRMLRIYAFMSIYPNEGRMVFYFS